jgi:SAM-dependent methyltransferase
MNDTYNFIINKYKIVRGRQYLIDIPEMEGGTDLVKLFAELGFKLGVEVGVDRGYFSEYMMKNIPDLKLFGVDPWSNNCYEDYNPYKLSQEYFEGCYNEAVERLKPFDNYKIIRKFSVDALKDFEDNSLDFVYIDANHDFLHFTEDLQYWFRKVRPGGIISGHDYVYYSYRKFNHVKRALIAYTRCYRMIPVFGTVEGHELKRDKYRSWFYVKQGGLQ